MNTKIVLAFVCVSVGVISAFPYPGKKILRTGLFKLTLKFYQKAVSITLSTTHCKINLKTKKTLVKLRYSASKLAIELKR